MKSQQNNVSWIISADFTIWLCLLTCSLWLIFISCPFSPKVMQCMFILQNLICILEEGPVGKSENRWGWVGWERKRKSCHVGGHENERCLASPGQSSQMWRWWTSDLSSWPFHVFVPLRFFFFSGDGGICPFDKVPFWAWSLGPSSVNSHKT